ncbi:hypothetical protein Q5424_01190 [Conexibacter sp. JD483]|uniref:hypothetical protein n=1 Tax=unclassified Conexibacter TaxID=2627773 RepID=UPI00271A9023|nr:MULTISPECIES: hypothetical protein [unclassified Conexibacter]MDO8185843.1 hypothetical protein [Conexibacter sp. CPCC 205706]MDO8198587.1 hypothetical protein [Conexibacter sp. CPCC 205762]MDR9367673.1 hypothetical protein [Conexibacter sp. JD483]
MTSRQLSLFERAPPQIGPTREILLRGAHADDPRLQYGQAPMFIAGLRPDDCRRLLDYAEHAVRDGQVARPRLDLSSSAKPNSCCGRASGDLWFMTNARGIDFRFREDDQQSVTWARLIRARRQQTEWEPGVAQARDLAEAYRLLSCYGRCYSETADYKDGWSPVPLVVSLASDVLGLGGDPAVLRASRSYMTDGVALALAQRGSA